MQKNRFNLFSDKATGYFVLAAVLLAIIIHGAQLLFLGYANVAITGGVVGSVIAGTTWIIYRKRKEEK